MREIKFRAKERSGEWHVGSLFVEDGMGIPYIVSGVNTHYETNYSTVEVVSETVGQYTGLKDADGREIYEGDVIRVCGSNGIVAYGEGEFIVRFEKAPSLLSHCVGGDFSNPERVTACRVIGNIHDNPELLK